LQKTRSNEMNLLSLTNNIIPEKEGGYSMKCLDWESVYTQGDTIPECKKSAIEATELVIELMNEGQLDKQSYPITGNHPANPYNFQLTFDIITAKYIILSGIHKKLRQRLLG